MAAVTFAEIPALLKEATRPLILTGAAAGDNQIDAAVGISSALDAYLAATGNTITSVMEKGCKRCDKEWIAEIIYSMQLPEWKGPDGKGKPDLIIFTGYLSSMLEKYLTALRIGGNCKTLTLDNKYIENATYSLLPALEEDWEAGLKGIKNNLQ